jgi:ribosome-binding factor A
MSKRLARLNEQLKREISALVRTQVRDPRVGLVTVTHVETAGDLGSARVRVRIIGTDAERAETLAGLKAAAPFLRHSLGQILSIRHIPELRFMEDHSLDHALRIEKILSDVLPAPEREGEDEDEEATGEAAADDEQGGGAPSGSDA